MKTLLNLEHLNTQEDIIFAIRAAINSGFSNVAAHLILGAADGGTILPTLGGYKHGVWNPFVAGGWANKKTAKLPRNFVWQLWSASREACKGNMRARKFLCRILEIDSAELHASNSDILMHGNPW